MLSHNRIDFLAIAYYGYTRDTIIYKRDKDVNIIFNIYIYTNCTSTKIVFVYVLACVYQRNTLSLPPAELPSSVRLPSVQGLPAHIYVHHHIYLALYSIFYTFFAGTLLHTYTHTHTHIHMNSNKSNCLYSVIPSIGNCICVHIVFMRKDVVPAQWDKVMISRVVGENLFLRVPFTADYARHTYIYSHYVWLRIILSRIRKHVIGKYKWFLNCNKKY